MAKKRQQQQKRSISSSITKRRVMLFGIIAIIAAGIGAYGYKSMIPVNGKAPAFGFPANHFIKATSSASSGYSYVSQSSGSVRGLRSSGGGGGIVNPTYIFQKGNLQSIHVINEDYNTHSHHNFNIDAFNVHTKDLGYFETQTMTFVPNKTGTFEYYCSIHPEMKGNIIVEGE
jgi:hypothetical protein